MKKLQWILIALLTYAGQALAGSAESQAQPGLLIWIFCAFGALILATQLIPGMLLLGAAFKGLFGAAPATRNSSRS